MEVILLEKVKNLGNVGDRVKVRPGYGRNYLIPFHKAVPATPENIARFEAERAELERRAQEQLAEAQRRKEQLEGLTVTITSKAGDEGKLFGSVGVRDIAEAVTEAGVPLAKNEVSLPEGPIRSVGEYEIIVHLHPDVEGTVKVNVVPE